MKTAILYTRTATDKEPSENNSLHHQEELLRDYCKEENVKIINVFSECCSGTTFNRTEFTRMIESFKVKSNIPNLLLVTDWDRFGRNAENAFDMILMLGRYDIKIQAINELLDLTVPENKLLYAIYLSAKGDSKLFHSLRIKKGIRIAKENKLKMKSQ